MRRIVVIVGHPRAGSYCGALAEAYRRGATAAGHEARLVALSGLRFDPILRQGYDTAQAHEPDLAGAHADIMAADHLVIVFPLWLGDMPALLKGFLERLLQPDLIEPARQGMFVKLLKGKSARVIMTMGMPGFVYRFWFGAHALRLLKRNILGFMGVGPIRSTIHGMIEAVPSETRERWLAEAEQMGREAV